MIRTFTLMTELAVRLLLANRQLKRFTKLSETRWYLVFSDDDEGAAYLRGELPPGGEW